MRGQKARWFGKKLVGWPKFPLKMLDGHDGSRATDAAHPHDDVTRHLVHLLALHTNLCGPHLKTASELPSESIAGEKLRSSRGLRLQAAYS